MLNKMFENKDTGEKVSIKNDDGLWFTLQNGIKIKKDSFFNKYTEFVDPTSFFNNSGNISELANKIKTVDPTKIVDNNNEQPIIKKIDESNNYENQFASKLDEKQKMINEFVQKQKEKEIELSQYKQLDEDKAVEQLINPKTYDKQPSKINNPNYPEFDPNVKMDRDKTSKDYYRQENINQTKNDEKLATEQETYKFFRGFKKNYKVTIDLKFDEMIADPEFLKLMMNNFEADVIKYYTQEIYKNIASNPQMVEDEIYKQLETIILGKKPVKKTTTRRKTIKKPVKNTTEKTDKNENIETKSKNLNE